jgi:hypothetical protein
VPEELHRAGVAAREAYLQHLEQMTAQSMKPTPALPPRTSGPEPDARIRRL